MDSILGTYNAAWLLLNGYNISSLLRGKNPEEAVEKLDAYQKLDYSSFPKISLLVPAYKEANVISTTIRNTMASAYPKDKLELLALVEKDDPDTFMEVSKIMQSEKGVRLIMVSGKHYKNKPNALNHGLQLANGEIIGVVDAEDMISKSLLAKAAYYIKTEKYDAVQGILDMSNDFDGWKNMMQRAEYAYWFRHMLPGLERSGYPVPFGGTTNFFKANVIKAMGGWDPKSLTEDFDIGIAFFNRNYKAVSIPGNAENADASASAASTDAALGASVVKSGSNVKIIKSVTREESPTNWNSWLRQRTRWQQGKIQAARKYAANPPNTKRGKFHTSMAVAAPHIAILNVSGIALSTYALLTHSLDLPITLITYVNMGAVMAYCAANALSYMEVTKQEQTKHRIAKAFVVGITTPAYWVMQWVADARALKLEYVNKSTRWEKTSHMGRHFNNKSERN